MAAIGKHGKRHPTDLTDGECERIKPLLAKPPRRGRKAVRRLAEDFDVIRYMARSGGGWRMLPNDFPPGRRSIGGSYASGEGRG